MGLRFVSRRGKSPTWGLLFYCQQTLHTQIMLMFLPQRAVAHANKHPAPNKFRQFSTPRVFDVLRNRRQNEILVAELAQQLTYSHLGPSTVIGGSHDFVTELLPALRIIHPGGACTNGYLVHMVRARYVQVISHNLSFRWPVSVVNPSVDNLYSIARESIQRHAKTPGPSKDDAALKTQAEILEMDDIEDFDSDNEKSTTQDQSTDQASLREGPNQPVQDVIVIDD